MDAPEATALDERQRTMAWIAYVFAPILPILILALARPEEKFVRWHAIHAIAFGGVLGAITWMFMVWVIQSLSADPTPGVVLAIRTVPAVVLVAFVALMFAAYHGKTWGVPGLTFFANRFA